MKLKTRSILEELNEIASIRNTDNLIESRATNIINSAINLIESIHKNYPPELADDLERRLLNSIKGQDANKFIRGVRRIAESRKNKTTSQLTENEK
jgi:actin-like ATPase involved in cell morphogenesis